MYRVCVVFKSDKMNYYEMQKLIEKISGVDKTCCGSMTLNYVYFTCIKYKCDIIRNEYIFYIGSLYTDLHIKKIAINEITITPIMDKSYTNSLNIDYSRGLRSTFAIVDELNDILYNRTMGGLKMSRYFEIEKVIFNMPATIVIWKDGTKTVVKCQPGDVYNKESGLALCFMKRALGNQGNFNDILNTWCEEEENNG